MNCIANKTEINRSTHAPILVLAYIVRQSPEDRNIRQ